MDKYEQTLDRVLRETLEGKLTWEMVSPGCFSEILVDPDRVVRTWAAKFQLGDKSFPLLFIERKVLLHNEYGEPYDNLESELCVLDKVDRPLLRIYDGLVDRTVLKTLGDVIADSNESTKEFFRALAETG